MKKIIELIAIGATVAVFALPAVAQQPAATPQQPAAAAAPQGCTPEAKLAWYNEFRQHFKGDTAKANELATKWLACPEAKGEEQHKCDQPPEIEGANAGLAISEGADRKRSRDAGDVQHGPEIAGLARRQKRAEIAGKYQRAPHDQHQAGEIVDPRLPDAARHLIDLGERF